MAIKFLGGTTSPKFYLYDMQNISDCQCLLMNNLNVGGAMICFFVGNHNMVFTMPVYEQKIMTLCKNKARVVNNLLVGYIKVYGIIPQEDGDKHAEMLGRYVSQIFNHSTLPQGTLIDHWNV